MNRIALSIALALGLAAGVSASPEEGPGPLPADPFAASPATLAPDWFAVAAEGRSAPLDDPEAGGLFVVKGRRSYTEERAIGDARLQLEQLVAEWLAPEVPLSWTPPAVLIDALILDRHVEPVAIDRDRLGLGDDPELSLPSALYVAAVRVDLDPDHRSPFLEARRRQVGADRTALLGGLGGFILACLAILALYIRADEATKGYYTNRLRLVALASAGAAGVLLYRLLA